MTADAADGLDRRERALLELRELASRDTRGDFPNAGEGAEAAGYRQHPADAASDVAERERQVGVLELLEYQLGEVAEARGRLERGTYGTCEACGDPIDDDRLGAIPETRYCAADQARIERGEAAAG